MYRYIAYASNQIPSIHAGCPSTRRKAVAFATLSASSHVQLYYFESNQSPIFNRFCFTRWGNSVNVT